MHTASTFVAATFYPSRDETDKLWSGILPMSIRKSRAYCVDARVSWIIPAYFSMTPPRSNTALRLFSMPKSEAMNRMTVEDFLTYIDPNRPSMRIIAQLVGRDSYQYILIDKSKDIDERPRSESTATIYRQVGMLHLRDRSNKIAKNVNMSETSDSYSTSLIITLILCQFTLFVAAVYFGVQYFSPG